MDDDQFLYDFQKTPRRAFSAALLQRLTQSPTPSPRPVFARRLAWGVLLAATALCLIVLAFAPARAYAQDILYAIGHIILRADPTYAEQYETTLQTTAPAPDEAASPIAWEAPGILTRAEAQSQAGFDVGVLTRPPADLLLVNRLVTPPDALNPFTAVITIYQSDDQILTLRQLSAAPDAPAQSLPVGDSPMHEVTVRGKPGVFIENLRLSTYVDENNQVAPAYASLLMWVEAAFTFQLQTTPGLPLQTMLDLADSITLTQ